MLKPARICPDCGETVEGRSNKIYCDDVCKGRHNRSINLTEHKSENLGFSEPIERLPLRHYPTSNLMAKREEDQDEAEERVRTDQHQASALHARFCALVRNVQQSAGKTLTARRLKSLRNDVDDLSSAYTAHPYLKLPHSQDKNRLKALYTLHDALQWALDEIADKNMFQSRESAFEISKKWRKQLRELLVEDF